ncbi:helix-turn-helix domain-containing protein [Citrobacter portucalensis]|uniref:helix-turn-helix domain-containing protein n=1 Tax=Citrobacter portucalensis TaxID=1639133 RepID=UPI00226B22E4|nr:helix-turn-helix transcriptional regulator [Citrobacter portucalensis]MCX8985144.1 helix-turn-helix domain-containing protein [Citrobacter portucalensis]
MAFSDRLREAISDLGISQSAFAERMETTPQTVWNWLSGTALPRFEMLERLPAVTGRPLYWFFMMDSDSLDGLTVDESRALEMFRRLLPGQRAMLFALMGGGLAELNQWAERYKA